MRSELSLILSALLLFAIIEKTSEVKQLVEGLTNPDADLPIKRLNAGHATTLKIPLEEQLERIRSFPHRKDALIRSLGATALKQRAARNLIIRVLLTIAYLNDLTECTALVMCEISCDEEVNRVANNYYDTYPTDDFHITYALEAAEKGRELGASYQCATCTQHYPLCHNEKQRSQVLEKYYYLLEITNYVITKLPA